MAPAAPASCRSPTCQVTNGADTIDISSLGASRSLIDGGNGNDVITAGAGIDSLIGGAGNDTLNGGAGNDTLDGGANDDTLDGGAGADVLTGGTGNDTYVVDDIGDSVVESAGSGTDLVQSSVTFTLAANVENLTLIGSGAIDGTGNTLANVITGNAAGNRLDGGAGNDTLTGGPATISTSSTARRMSSPRTPARAPTSCRARRPSRWQRMSRT